jgi:hypothetical protein
MNSSGYSYFVQQLKRSQRYEKLAQQKICQMYDCEIVEEQNKTNYKTMHYDFKTSNDVTYEVKCDWMSNITGNLFIEFKQFGKPSGIMITIATCHIFYTSGSFWLIKTETLDILVKGCKIAHVKKTNSKGFLLDIDTFYKHAIEI